MSLVTPNAQSAVTGKVGNLQRPNRFIHIYVYIHMCIHQRELKSGLPGLLPQYLCLSMAGFRRGLRFLIVHDKAVQDGPWEPQGIFRRSPGRGVLGASPGLLGDLMASRGPGGSPGGSVAETMRCNERIRMHQSKASGAVHLLRYGLLCGRNISP